MKKKLSKIHIVILMLVVFCVGGMVPVALAEGAEPRYSNVGSAAGTISHAGQKFTVTITGISDVTQINVTANLYETGFFSDTLVGTLSASSSGSTYYGEKACTIRTGKSYRLEISASVYLNGSWETISKTATANF